MSQQSSVLERYSAGAKAVEAELCCPVDYDAGLLAMLPREIIDKDYGCGDPSRYVRDGDTVLDLGSGGGKICYMAAQLTGTKGRVIGVDMNDDMLSLARSYQDEMAEKLGNNRVEFKKGHIHDLALDLDEVDKYLAQNPVRNSADFSGLESFKGQQRRENPMIADNTVDLVVSNCVLNLVDDAWKGQLLREIFRVLKPGGRVAVSDIISDKTVPQRLRDDPELWSGCISGVFQEQEFIRAFTDSGFVHVAYDKWDAKPWKTVEDIIFRSATLTAVKPLADGSKTQRVMYKGPYAGITDDHGRVYQRGTWYQISEGAYAAMCQAGRQADFICADGKARDALASIGVTGEACCAPAQGGGSCC